MEGHLEIKSDLMEPSVTSSCEIDNDNAASSAAGYESLCKGPDGTQDRSADRPSVAEENKEGNADKNDATTEIVESLAIREHDRKLHPILRCPVDILREIFEWTVKTSQWRLKGALWLSQVCRKWREVAIATPRLWYAIAFSVQEQDSMITSLMDVVLPRVRSVPAKFLLFDIDTSCEPEIAWEALNLCKLDRLTLLAEMELIGEDPLSLSQLTWPSGGTLPIPCKRLSLATKKDESSAPSLCKLTDIIACLSGCEQVQVEDMQSVLISRHECLENIKSLVVVGCLQLFWPVTGLSNLTLLYLESIELCDILHLDHPNICELPALRSLTVYLVTAFPWGRLVCPQITTCRTYGDYGKMLPQFLLRHRTITSLETKITEKQDLFPLAVAADQIESFYYSGDVAHLVQWEESNLQSPPFPKLNSLFICHEVGGDGKAELPLEVFEKLVKSRVLKVPSFLRPIEHFAVAHLPKEPKLDEWKKSPLFLSSSQTYQTENLPYIIESTRHLLKLHWPVGYTIDD